MVAGTVLLMALLTPAVRGGPQHALGDIATRFARTARAVATWTPCSGTNAWELSDLVEGDIMPSGKQMRLVAANETLKWENNTVRFLIATADFDATEAKQIRKIVAELNGINCLQLLEITEEVGDFVRIMGQPEGCWSHVGRIGGPQAINLQKPACLSKGNAVHEFFHAFGFHHTHNSPNRNKYIRIKWHNILDDKKNFFKIHTKEEATTFGLRYDYGSIMHASRRAHSKNDFDTIETIDPTVTIGQRVKPSPLDIALLRRHYNCRG